MRCFKQRELAGFLCGYPNSRGATFLALRNQALLFLGDLSYLLFKIPCPNRTRANQAQELAETAEPHCIPFDTDQQRRNQYSCGRIMPRNLSSRLGSPFVMFTHGF
jgi:hypothetical protein